MKPIADSVKLRLAGLFEHPLREVLPRDEPFEHEAAGRQVDEGFRILDLQLVLKARVLRAHSLIKALRGSEL
jgi:hypothetical protein